MIEIPLNLEIIMRKKLPERFEIFYDGWSGCGMHFVGVYWTLPSDHERGYDKNFFPALRWSTRKLWCQWALQISSNNFRHFWNTRINFLVAVVSGNFTINLSIPCQISIPFIGFHSHWYNLAIQDILAEHHHVTRNVSLLMKRSSFKIRAAIHRHPTRLRSQQCNQIRCNSFFKISKIFIELKAFANQVDDTEVQNLLPDEDETVGIKLLFEKLGDLYSVNIALKSESFAIFEAQNLFHAVITRHSSTRKCLGLTVRIVENEVF